MADNSHLMLFYKGDISALMLFCKWPNGGICYPPLPKLSAIIEEGVVNTGVHELHPKKLLKEVNDILDVDEDLIELEPAFYEQVEQPDGIKTVYMARFKVLDPPHQLLEDKNCKFQTMTDLIGSSPTEMELIRRAYTLLMEG